MPEEFETQDQNQTGQTQEPNLTDLINQVTEPKKEGDKPPEPKPINVNLMGQSFQFKDESDLSSQLSQYIQGLQQQIQQPPPSNYVSGKEDDTNQPPKWTDEDMKEYVRLMQSNPIEAQNYVDRKRFGTEDPVKMIKQTTEENQRLNRSLAAIQFRDAHPDLPLNPQVAAALEQRRSQLGVPFTYEGLEASYWSLVGNRVLPPPQSLLGNQPQYQQQQQFQQPQQQQFQRPAPPPAVPRSAPESVPDFDISNRFEQMSKDDLARVLTEYQMRSRQGR